MLHKGVKAATIIRNVKESVCIEKSLIVYINWEVFDAQQYRYSNRV